MEKTVFDSPEILQEAAAMEVVRIANDSVDSRGRFTLVLAGGTTPRALYQTLSQDPFQQEFPWQKTHFFWGDERWVALDHEHSNYAMAYQTLLAPKKELIPSAHIHPMADLNLTPGQAAQRYEQEIQQIFELNGPDHWPVFDLVLLGLGPDGHTLSLFPGDDHHLQAYRRLVVQVYAPTGNPPGHRLSLTLPVVNHARHVLFLVTGKNKREVVREIWTNPELAKERFPAAAVAPQGELVWMVDQEAGDIYGD